ncbi:MAG: phenylalanine--tRNA ligase subunit beta [Armatimonadetes bacterium]|nr:phenylalanine--tRNA ligase subunit beta [Armatimonadota bacterium]
MQVPYSWLKEMLGEAPGPEELAHILTMGGLEVEDVVPWRSADGAAEDTILFTAVTSNRGDLLSMVGTARQAAALLGLDWAPRTYSLPETEKALLGADSVSFGDVKVQVLAPAACPRYSALLIDGVRVGASPDWLRLRLEAAGLRSINNVVDATNYVLWELGQPLHAFDAARITDRHVIVRMANPGEKIVTLDGQERELSDEDLIIADPSGAIALAGVMGGLSTEVTDATTRVLLEAAHFDATTVRRTSLRTGLSTEASYRFERGVDPNLTLPSLARVAEIILQVAGGRIEGPALDIKARDFEPRRLLLRPARCRALLGAKIARSDMATFLCRLGMEVDEASAGDEDAALSVTVPTFRPDIEREVDLIEEVAIVYGYDNIPMTVHGNLKDTGKLTDRQKLERRARALMRQAGLNEAVHFSMMDPADLDRLQLPPDAPERHTVNIANPMSAEASCMRTTLLAGLLWACVNNQNVGVADVALFEVGKVFIPAGESAQPLEPKRVAGVLMGNPFSAEWNLAIGLDFFWLKGLLEQFLCELGVQTEWRRGSHPSFHPGQCAEVCLAGRSIGVAGVLAPAVLEAFDLREKVFAFELDLDAVLDAAETTRAYQPLPKFPPALRDVAVVAPDDDEHCAARLEAAIRAAGGEHLEDVRLFDVFADEAKLGPGRRSLAFHLVWRAPDRTLRDEEVDQLMAKVFGALSAAGAEVRDR